MGIHTGSVEKRTGSNPNLGGPIQWTSIGLESTTNDTIMAATTQNTDDGPQTYTEESGDIIAQPLHPRPIRVVWGATSGTVNAVIFELRGWNFWRDPTDVETIRLTAEGSEDSNTSFREVGSLLVRIQGAVGSTADVSLGIGLGLGSPVPFIDLSRTIGDIADTAHNKDIIAVRDPTDDTALQIVDVLPDPYNTIICRVDAETPAVDVKVEMQTRFGILAGRS